MNQLFIKKIFYFSFFIIVFFGFFGWAGVAKAAVVNISIFTSKVEDFTAVTNFGVFSWTASTTPGVTAVTMQVRSGTTAVPASDSDPDWTSWTAISSGDTVGAPLDGKRYFQYRATLTSEDISQIASLDDVQINWSSYDTSDSLIGSPYDSTDTGNTIAGLSWTQTSPMATSTGITIYLRTGESAEALASANWTAVATTTQAGFITSGCTDVDGVVTCGLSAIPTAMKATSGNRWFQYKIELTSGGDYTPTLQDITVTYLVNAPPVISNLASSQSTSTGQVIINYAILDSDTSSGTAPPNGSPGYVSPTFEYSLDNGSTWTAIDMAHATNTPDDGTGEVKQPGSYSGNFGVLNKVIQATSTPYTLTWDMKGQTGGNAQYSTTAKIRLTINDNELSNNTDTSDSTAFTIDTTDSVATLAIDARSDATSKLTFSVTENTMDGLKMKISNNSGLSSDGQNANSGSWVDYATTTSWTFTGDTSTVYYQVKDKYNNISQAGAISSASAPATPTNVLYQDVSNVSTNEWREFIAWGKVVEPGPGFKRYNIYRSTDGITYTPIDPILDRTTNFKIDADLDTAQTYYYRITSQDDNDNISAYSNVVTDRPDGQGGSDLTSPTLSGLTITSITAESATVTWNTNEPSNSFVDYITVTGGDFSASPSIGVASMMDTVSSLGQHIVVLSGLTPGTPYYIQARSEDPTNNEGTLKDGVDGYTFNTLSGPTISTVSVSGINNYQATITWQTNLASDSYVYYSTNSSLSGPTPAGQAEAVFSHSVTLSSLTAGQIYYYYVKSGVGEDKHVVEGEIVYYNFETANDLAVPLITFASETDITNLADTGATVAWTTDKQATSTLEYGTSLSYGTTLSNTNYNTNHSYNLSNLTKGTTYYLRLKNSDINNNVSTATLATLTTTDSTDILPPTISSITVSPIYDNSAVVTWSTNEASTSTINYGLVSATYTASSLNSALNLAHSQVLSSLTASTTYYFAITATDSNGNATTSVETSFATIAELSTETEVQARETTARAAGVASVPVSGGGGGIVVVNNNNSDKVAPTISQVEVDSRTGAISWQTSETADGVIEFGLFESYGSAVIDWNRSTSHTLSLNSLLSSTTYYYKIISTDASGNRSLPTIGSFVTSADVSPLNAPIGLTASSTPMDKEANDLKFSDVVSKMINFIRTAAKSISISAMEASLADLQKSLKELATLTPSPKINADPVIKTWEDMAVISWETNERTSSLVAFSELGVTLTDTKLAQVIGNPEVLQTTHQVILAGLKPDTTYNYQLRGVNALGSKLEFAPAKFKTTAKVAKIDNYTVDRLSDEKASFKWSSSLPTDTSVRITPYHDNVLAQDEARVVNNKIMTSLHEMTISNFEPGVFYKIDLFGQDNSGRSLSQSIEAFSTVSNDLPLLIEQIKSDSALAFSEGTQVQTIVSWNTTISATSKIYYRPGTSNDETNWPKETTVDKNYTRRHLVVMTDFAPGEIYQLQVESVGTNGQTARSKTFTILTPRQRESVFQVIIKNVEQTFGWLSKMNKQ